MTSRSWSGTGETVTGRADTSRAAGPRVVAAEPESPMLSEGRPRT